MVIHTFAPSRESARSSPALRLRVRVRARSSLSLRFRVRLRARDSRFSSLVRLVALLIVVMAQESSPKVQRVSEVTSVTVDPCLGDGIIHAGGKTNPHAAMAVPGEGSEEDAARTLNCWRDCKW